LAQQSFTVHEMMEVHEMLNFKTVCTLKSKMMFGLVRDEDLQALLELDVKQSVLAIQAMQNLLAATQLQ